MKKYDETTSELAANVVEKVRMILLLGFRNLNNFLIVCNTL